MNRKDERAIEELRNAAMPGSKVLSIQRLGGLTNRSYHVTCADGEYVFRLPGEGTETLINRVDEQRCTEIASRLGIDAELLYFNTETGEKISRYIREASTMDEASIKEAETISLVSKTLKKLHSSGADMGVTFGVFDMARRYEEIIQKENLPLFNDYAQTRAWVYSLHERDSKLDIKRAACHNDPLCENWIRSGKRIYLVDWEYAGMNDPMWDLADVSIEAGFSLDQDEFLLSEYGNGRATAYERERFAVNKIYIDFLWALWGKAREAYDGAVMRHYAEGRYSRLLRNLAEFRRA